MNLLNWIKIIKEVLYFSILKFKHFVVKENKNIEVLVVFEQVGYHVFQ